MKKLVVTSIVAALVAGALVAPAEAGKRKKPKTRTMEGTYANPAVGVPGVVGTSNAGGAVEFVVMSNESSIAVTIDDDRGGTPVFTMSQNSDPADDTYEIIGTWCGETPEPVAILPGLAVRVSVYTTPGPGQPTCVSPASSGTIVATFGR